MKIGSSLAYFLNLFKGDKMHPLAMLFIGIYLIVQGLEYLGFTFGGSNIIKGLCLAVAGTIFVVTAL